MFTAGQTHRVSLPGGLPGSISKSPIAYKFIHSVHWHVQNATIPCRSQKLLPFLSVMCPFLPSFSIN